MPTPEIKIISVSNVYCRLMNFVNAGDYEIGHYHDYDHGTLLSKGRLSVEMFDDKNEIVGIKYFNAPTFIFIKKNHKHRLVALEDNTVATCIHALRTIDEEIIPSDFFVEEIELADSRDQVTDTMKTIGEVMYDKGLEYKYLARSE